MGKIINAYTVDPMTIGEGDVALCAVKVMMVRQGFYRLYRCQYMPDGGGELPQGSRIFKNVRETCEALFPSVAAVAEPDG